MRMEELEGSRYIKSTDSVEKYLLGIIQEYFKNSNTTLEGSKEFIIQEAVDRLRSEMDYNSLGVLSITLPDGKARVGDVTITLKDLGGEPLISPKLSAFNVDFGDQANTACEGNDYRLTNAREPLQHKHEIQDVAGLEGILSTIQGKIDRADANSHTHSNKNVLDKLTYTGTNKEIDLSIIDDLEPKIDKLTTEIKNNIKEYVDDTGKSIDEINKQLQEINTEIDKIKDYVINKCEDYLKQAKEYADQKTKEATDELNEYIKSNYVTKDKVQTLIDLAKQCYTLVGVQKWSMDSILSQVNESHRTTTLEFNQDILSELQDRSIEISTSDNIIFDCWLIDKDKNKYPIPLIDTNKSSATYLFNDYKQNTVGGYIEMMQNNQGFFDITFNLNYDHIPEALIHGTLECSVYANPICNIAI